MSRMWQKYTPGKRILALLLAVLMMADSFTVSAATTDTEVSTEISTEEDLNEISTETSTEAEASQPEDTEETSFDGTEIDSETVYTEENTEKPVMETPDEVVRTGDDGLETHDYHWRDEDGNRLKSVTQKDEHLGPVYQIPYAQGDVTLWLYDGETQVKKADVSLICYVEAYSELVQEDEEGNCKVVFDGAVLAEQTPHIGLYLKSHSGDDLKSWEFAPSEWDLCGIERAYVPSGETYQFEFANHTCDIGLVASYEDIALSSSAEDIVSVKNNGYDFEFLAHKLGTATLTMTYTAEGETITKTLNVEVISSENEAVLYYRDKTYGFTSAATTTGGAIVVETDEEIDLFTNVSPRLLSNLKLSVADENIASLSDSISETETDYGYINKTYAKLIGNKEGTTTITFSATYKGKAYTGTYTVVVSDKAVSDFWNASDDSKDIEEISMGDYKVAFKTVDGSKAAVLTGYQGSDATVYMPKSFTIQVVEDGTLVEKVLPVIGAEDGVFDTEAGYTQPSNVYVYEGYTYFGEEETGWIHTGGTKRTIYDMYDDEDELEDAQICAQNGMLFIKKEGRYTCFDAGNVSTVPVVEDTVVLYKNSTNPSAEIKLHTPGSVSGYTTNNSCLMVDEATPSALGVDMRDGTFVVSCNDAANIESGTYYLFLKPYVIVEEQYVYLPVVSTKVTVSIDGAAPEVKITNSSLTLNTYLATQAAVVVNVTNSFGTEVTGISWATEAAEKAAAKAGLYFTRGYVDNQYCWLLKWNGGTIPKNLKLEVAFEVEGFTESENTKIATQTITVNTKKVQPTTKLSATTVTFAEYPYTSQTLQMTITDGLYDGDIQYFSTKCTSMPKGASASDVQIYRDYSADTLKLSVNVSNRAVSGTYKYTITPSLGKSIYAKPVTLTVVVKGTKPAVKFASTATVTLNSNYYNTTETLPQLVYSAGADASKGVSLNGYASYLNGSLVNWSYISQITTEVTSKPKNADASLVTLTALYDGKTLAELEKEKLSSIQDIYSLDKISFAAGVKSGATAGTYVFKIKVPLTIDEYGYELVWAETTATVKVVNTLPTFKLTASTVTLDAGVPYNEDMGDVSSAFIKLMLDDGYKLVVPATDDDEGVDTEALEKVTTFDFGTNQNAEECVMVESLENGMLAFGVVRAGLTKGGTITINPVVEAPTGEIIELKPVKVTLKVTNSSKATLNSKVKAMTVNSYLNTVEAVANLSVKGFTETAGLDYTYNYEFVPADANAAWAEENGYLLKVSDDGTTISAVKKTAEETEGSKITDGWSGIKDGKYTYNLVGVVTAKEEEETVAVTYTKPLTFTVTVKAKALTVVPKSSSITVYTDIAETVERGEDDNKTECYKLTIPVSVKEQAGIEIQSYGTGIATNSMSAKGVETKFVSDDNGGSLLVITYPCDIYKTVKKLTITPNVFDGVDMAFSSFAVTIAHKTTGAKAAFKDATVTLNRYETDRITNSITDAESFSVTGMEIVSITKKGSKTDVKDELFDAWTNEANISVSIKAEKIDAITNGTYTVTVKPQVEEMQLQNCSFNINITQPKLTLSVSEKTVNLYPEIKYATTASVRVSATNGDAELEVTKTEATATSKNTKTYANAGWGDRVYIGASYKNEKPVYGTDTYNMKVYVKNYMGSEDVLAGTISKAVTVAVKALPSKATLTSSKLTFSPYLEESVSTSIKDTELMALSGDGKINYRIAVSETNSKYKELAEDKKNDILEVTADSEGVITATAKKLPDKNATYYYTATVSLKRYSETVKTYTVNFQIAVKNTMPKAALRETTVTLNNAYPDMEALGNMTLSTGNAMWKLADMDNWDIVVKNSKNQDVTDKNYFDVDFTEGTSFITSLYTETYVNEEGIFAVPTGTYKIEITPTAAKKNAGDEPENITLAKTVLTVKVVSNRPTVKYAATKLTVNTYTNQPQATKLTLSNGGKFVEGSAAVCAKAPKGVTVKEDGTVEGISLTLAENGTLTAQAGRNVTAGTYTYTITPVTEIDGYKIALDSKNVTVVVQSTMPTAVLSTNKVSVNTLFADTYSAEIKVTAKNAGENYTYAFTTDEIVFNEPKAKQTKKEDAAVLLENMDVSVGEDGTAVIRVGLPTDKTVANGTYSFKLTPGIQTGSKTGAEYDNAAYDLKAVTFSVVVENKKPTVSAKVSGSIDLVKRSTSFVTAQLSFSKQAYETLGDIENVRLIDKSTGKTSSDFFVNGRSDITAGTVVISTNYRKELAAGKTYALQVEVTTRNGGTYLTNVNVKTTQSNYKVTGAASVFYTEADSANINLTVTEGVSLKNVKVTKAVIGKKTLKADDFGCTLRNSGESIELWSEADLTQYKGQTMKVTFEVTPNGLASNKKPVTITVSLTIK